MERARDQGVGVPAMVTTDYINTIPADAGAVVPRRRGASSAHPRVRSAGTRWRWSTGPTTASTASAVTSRRSRRRPRSTTSGFNHFWHGKSDGGCGDQVFIQGHAAPGIYARAFLEGRLTEEHLDRFRREVFGGGLPELPAPAAHARTSGSSRPSRWASARSTRSYQARFNRYLLHHELVDTSGVAGLVLRRRRRDGRARGDRRALDRGA